MSFAERCFSSGYFENPVTCPNCHTEFEGPVPDEGEDVATLAGYREEVKYLRRLRIEIVGALTAAGICMLVDADPTAYGEVRSAVKRLAAERDEAENELAAETKHTVRLRLERNALREQNRIRDARVEKPKPGVPVLVWYGTVWERDMSRFACPEWVSGNRNHDSPMFADFPFWLPMPPAPETR